MKTERVLLRASMVMAGALLYFVIVSAMGLPYDAPAGFVSGLVWSWCADPLWKEIGL